LEKLRADEESSMLRSSTVKYSTSRTACSVHPLNPETFYSQLPSRVTGALPFEDVSAMYGFKTLKYLEQF